MQRLVLILIATLASASAALVVVADEGQPASPEVSAPGELKELSPGTDAAHSNEPPATKGESHATAVVPADSPGASGAHDAGHAEAEHGGHAAGHDPSDLSHANASSTLNSPEAFKSDLAIWTFVVFFVLLALLGKFAWGPVMDGLEKREHSIAQMIDEAKQSQVKAAEQLKIYEARLAAAGEEARAIVVQARQDAQVASERILAEAEQAAQRERQRAVEDINNAKNNALQAITERSVDLAVGLAGRIVRRQLNKEDHAQLMREALEQLPSRN